MAVFNIKPTMGHPPANIGLVAPGSEMNSLMVNGMGGCRPGCVGTLKMNLNCGPAYQGSCTLITGGCSQIIDDVSEILMDIAVKGPAGHGSVRPEETPQRDIDAETGNENNHHHFGEDGVENLF